MSDIQPIQHEIAHDVIGLDDHIKDIVFQNSPRGGGGGGFAATTFLDLTDTPATYVGQAGKTVAVNATATGLEFVTNVATDEKAKVSANDTTAGYLNGKLVAGTGISLTENNDGANETLTVGSTVNYGSGTQNYLAKWASATTLGDSIVRESSGKIGIGRNPTGQTLEVEGNILLAAANPKLYLLDGDHYITNDGSNTKFFFNTGGFQFGTNAVNFITINDSGDARGKDFVATRSVTITRDVNNYITSVAKTGGRTITITRDVNNYITSASDTTNTWTISRDVNNYITGVTVT